MAQAFPHAVSSFIVGLDRFYFVLVNLCPVVLLRCIIADNANYDEVFEGYGKVVAGDIAKRRCEVLPLKDMRTWMHHIAVKAIKHAQELAAAHV